MKMKHSPNRVLARTGWLLPLVAVSVTQSMGTWAQAEENARALSIGGGISSPSLTTSIHENPAGLVLNQSPKLQFSIANERGAYQRLLGTSLGFFAGNKAVGAMVGYQAFSNSGDNLGSISRFTFGIAAHSELMNTTFAFSGSYRFAKPGSDPEVTRQKPWTTNFGILYNPHGAIRVGTTVYGIQNQVEAVGAGLSADINSNATVSLDASTNDGLNGVTVKPGIGAQVNGFSLSYSYGIRAVRTTNEFGISTGNTFAVAVDLTPQFRVTGSYNQNSLYCVGGTFRF